MSDQREIYDLIRLAANVAEHENVISLEDRNLLVAWAERSQQVRDALAADPNRRAERLRRAAVLVQEVVESCDTSMHECPTCHLKKNDNWDDQKLSTELGAVVKKLERHAGSLESTRVRLDDKHED
jgi:hypothetical protein